MRLIEAAQTIPTDPSCLRRALNRFGIVDTQEDGQRTVDDQIVQLFAQTKRTSGYLYPRTITTLAELLAAAAKVCRNGPVTVTENPVSERPGGKSGALLETHRAAAAAHTESMRSDFRTKNYRSAQE